MQGETVVFNPGTNQFFVLNASAAVLWDSLATPQEPSRLAARIQESFDGVTEAQARQDVEHTLRELESFSLIVVAE